MVYNIPGHATAELILIPVEFGITWAVGFALRARSEQAEAAETRAERAERERDAAARIAVAEERSRIARELHDVVAHAVSVMVLQVGAVRHKLPETEADDREALRGVERAGRTALTEMGGCWPQCAGTERKWSSTPSPAWTGWTSCSKRSVVPVCPSSCTSTESRWRSRAASISPRTGSCKRA